MAQTIAQRRNAARELLDAIDQLDKSELHQVARHVQRLLTDRTPGDAQAREAELIRLIRRQKPRELRIRYPILVDRRRAESLRPDEHDELLRLTERAEAFNVQWLESLSELATLRQTSVRALMQDLGIWASSNV